MTNSATSSISAHGIEHLLASLHGVRSARVMLGDANRIDEIHVLCSPALQTKQVVRNVESALSAGLGIHVDRRIISVAQLREDMDDIMTHSATAEPRTATSSSDSQSDAPQPATLQSTAPRSATPQPASLQSAAPQSATPQPATPQRPRSRSRHGAPGAADRRFVFVAFDARTQAGTAVCRVSVRRGRCELEGTGSGPNTLQGRASAAAEALFNAVAKADDVGRVGLDGAAIVELSGQRFVLVSAHGAGGRDGVQLTGVAALARSPEETAILAALQAANRWAEPR